MATQPPIRRPVWFDDPDDFARFRDLLRAARYSDEGITELLGVDEARSISGDDMGLLLRRSRGGSPLETLVRLFLIDVPVPAASLAAAVAPMTVEGWAEAGLIEPEGPHWRAAVKLLPFQDWLVAFDHSRRIDQGDFPDYVMGIAGSTLTLAQMTIRRRVERALDLGTGCGFHAFAAAGHSRQVVATDFSARAVGMAEFNARLNALENVECRQGDLFEPVAGERFGLVVTNPPFVISPERRYVYRDGGLSGDEMTRTIVARVPEVLEEGGFCQILCNWAQPEGDAWGEHLTRWFEGTGCDAWVLRSDSFGPDTYASKWIRHTERDEAEAFARRLDEWIEYYQEQGIASIGLGLVTMRRRTGGPNWFRAEEVPPHMAAPVGEGILLGFTQRDFLEAYRDDGALLASCLRASPHAKLDQQFEPTAEGWCAAASKIRLTRGLGFEGQVDPYMAQLIVHCDGRRPLGELMDELARSIGEDPAGVVPAALAIVRRLIEQGFLLPAEAEAEGTS